MKRAVIVLLALSLSACAVGTAAVSPEGEPRVTGIALGASEICAYRQGSEASSTADGATADKEPGACIRGGHGSEPFWTMVGGAVGALGAYLGKLW